jgi:hypothetical protein
MIKRRSSIWDCWLRHGETYEEERKKEKKKFKNCERISSQRVQGLNTASYNSTSLMGYYKNISVFGLKLISHLTVVNLCSISFVTVQSPIVSIGEWTGYVRITD